MKIKWKSVYYPIGQWEDEDGNGVSIGGNGRCTYQGRELLIIMVNAHCPAGHGESAIDALVPSFIDSETLRPVAVEGFVEVDSSQCVIAPNLTQNKQ